jgi:hypothetical protein
MPLENALVWLHCGVTKVECDRFEIHTSYLGQHKYRWCDKGA